MESITEISTSEVKKKSVRGVVVLTGRTFILQAVSLVAQLVLFAYLGQYEFGVFAIVSAVINFLTYFSDIGLAAALIQKKEQPTTIDLRTTFTIQQGLVLVLVGFLFIFSKDIAARYFLDTSGLYLMYALGVSLFLTSLKSIPSVLLERKLDFIKLVFAQILENLVYNIVLVVMAIKGYGVMSFSVAVLARSIVGLVTIYTIQRWKVGFALSLSTLKDLFRFGIPYQVNTLLATFKDDGMTLVLGSIIEPSGVGVLSFAQKIARYPLTFFMDNVTRVTFPAFSRLQDKPADLARSTTRSIFFITLLVFPSLAGLVLLMPWIVVLVPKYSQWTVALIPLIFVSINFAFAAATTQLTNLLNAIGKIKITFYLMIMWTVLTWLLIPVLSSKFGVVGASVGYSLVGISSIVAIYLAKKLVNFSITDSIVKPLLATLVMIVTIEIVKRMLPINFYSLQLIIILGAVTYAASIISIVGISLLEDAKRSLKIIFSRKENTD